MVSDRHRLGMQLDGWCILENIIPQEALEEIRNQVTVSTNLHRNPNAHQNVAHVSGVLKYNQSLAPYLTDSRLFNLVESLLGKNFRISFTSATINEPGNARGGWHADWPFNQRNAGHVPAPYPDTVMHLTTIWMLSSFSGENGGTLIVPGSHRASNNPTGDIGVAPNEPYPTELNVTGEAGSVLVMDSRLWHATAANTAGDPRVAVVVRFAPWWLNLNILMPGSGDRKKLVDETSKNENVIPALPQSVYNNLPDELKSLVYHWVEGTN